MKHACQKIFQSASGRLEKKGSILQKNWHRFVHTIWQKFKVRSEFKRADEEAINRQLEQQGLALRKKHCEIHGTGADKIGNT